MNDNNFDIFSDGKSVWVNTMEGNIGRFGRMGIDIHNTISEQERTGVQCRFCTHGPTSAEDWPIFVAKMLELHGAVVGEDHRPHSFMKQ